MHVVADFCLKGLIWLIFVFTPKRGIIGPISHLRYERGILGPIGQSRHKKGMLGLKIRPILARAYSPESTTSSRKGIRGPKGYSWPKRAV